MDKRNSFDEYKWFTVRNVEWEMSCEMGVFQATTRNHFRVKLEKVVHKKFPDIKIPDEFDPLSPTLIHVSDSQVIVVVETKIF